MAVRKKLKTEAGKFQCAVCKCRRVDELLDKVYSNSTKKSICTVCTAKWGKPHVPKIVSCEICRNPYDIRVDGSKFLPHTTKLACAVCMGKYGSLTTRTDKTTEPAWFVLSCEPGKENAVRKRIMKTAKTRKVQDKILRLYSPVHHVERMIPSFGELVGEGSGLLNPNDARAEVKAKIWELERDNPGVVYRDRIFQDEKSGKWGWKVRVDLQEETLAVVKRRKYPGYLLVHMIYDKDTAELFKRQGKCWGLLLQDYVTVGLKAKVSWLKSRGAWRWSVVNLKGVELTKGHVSGTGPKDKPSNLGKDAAWEAARMKAETMKTDKDLPTGLESEEAAIEVLNDKLVKEIEKDKDRKAALSTIPYKVGDTVIIKHGAWTNNKARVAVIDREPGNPEASVLVTMNTLGGTMVSLRFKHHQIVKEFK